MTKARSNATAEAAKGDLRAGAGTNLSGILAVGSNGDTLVADSSTSTGLRYQGSMAAGRNFVINGGMDIWQRNTSVAGSSTNFTADRWQAYRAVAGSTFTRQTTNDTTNLPSIQYCLRVARDSGNSAVNPIFTFQSFETVNSIPLAGKTVTVSFYARAGANYSAASNGLVVNIETGTGTDQNYAAGFTGGAATINQTATLTTTWQRFSYTATIPAATKQIASVFYYTPVGTAGAADYFEVTGVQLEVGSVATQFSRTGGTIQGELAACQRYFERMQSGGVDATFGMGVAYSASAPLMHIQYQTPKRVVPSFAFAGTWELIGGNTIITMTSPVASGNAVSVFGFQMSGTASGMTVGHAQLLRSGTDTPYIDISAEL